MTRRLPVLVGTAAVVTALVAAGGGLWPRPIDLAAQSRPRAVDHLRLYLFDLGLIPVANAKGMFNEPLEVAKDVCCVIVGHLIVHPRGTLLWDVGVVPDAEVGTGAKGAERAGKRTLK